jgi:DNA-binding Lrp family transcriptional regulator
MAKAKTTKAAVAATETVVTESVIETPTVVKTTLEDLTKEELVTRYEANVAERRRLADENKVLCELYKSANSSAKKNKAEAKIAELQAKLNALQNPTPVTSDAPSTAEAPATELAG